MPSRRRERLALIATHPIQYQVPWFRSLASCGELEVKVFFGLLPNARQQGVGFGVEFHWDIPLREGYDSEVLENVAKHPTLGSFSGCDAPNIGERLRQWSPDAVLLTGWQSKMLVQAWWATTRLGLPRLLRGESNALRPRPMWKRAGHRVWLHRFDQFLAIGEANRQFYLDANVAPERIHSCPYFVDNDRFANTAAAMGPQREEMRGAWGIPSDAICFLFSGKLAPKKRPLDLLEALKGIDSAKARVHLLVAGAGELHDAMRQAVETFRLPVTFTGFLNQTEIVRAYVAADCLILPSDYGETWGLVVNEAMACGLPALVSDRVGSGPDLVIEGRTGATFPMGDHARIAELMATFASDPNGVVAMGARARDRVFADYSVERAVDGTLAALDAALGMQRRD